MGLEELPEGWSPSTIGEITTFVEKVEVNTGSNREIKYIDISSIDNERNAITSPKYVKLSEAPSRARQIVKSGDVVFSLVRPYLKNIAFVDASLDGEIASTGFSVLRTNGAADKKYLFFKCLSQEFVNSLSGKQYGVNYPAVKDEQVRNQPIAIPPLNEQRRIVEKIETLFSQLDAGEAALRAVQKQLARYRQSVLKAAVTGALTADWRAQNAHRLEHGRELLARILQTRRNNWQGRGKYKEPAAPDASDLPELPQGWVWATTEQLAFVETGATPKKGNPEFYKNGSIPWITSTAVNENLIFTAQDLITEEAIEKTNAKVFPVGSLIIAMYGEGKTRGMVSELGIDAATNQACAALLVGHLPGRVTRFLKNFFIYNYEAIRLLSSGGVQPNLNLSIIKETALPLPPEAEVEEINEQVSALMQQIEVLNEICQSELTRSAALRQSILKDAFSGKLVPQDPADEPASALLARIRAERAAGAAPKRRGRSTAGHRP